MDDIFRTIMCAHAHVLCCVHGADERRGLVHRGPCTSRPRLACRVAVSARLAKGVAARHIGIKPIYSVSMSHIRSLQPLVSPMLCA